MYFEEWEIWLKEDTRRESENSHSISFSRCESIDKLSISSSSGGSGGLLYKKIKLFPVLSSRQKFFSIGRESSSSEDEEEGE